MIDGCGSCGEEGCRFKEFPQHKKMNFDWKNYDLPSGKKGRSKPLQLPDWAEIWGLRLLSIVVGLIAGKVFYWRFYNESLDHADDATLVAFVLGGGICVLFKYVLEYIYYYSEYGKFRWTCFALVLICALVFAIDLSISNATMATQRATKYDAELENDLLLVESMPQLISWREQSRSLRKKMRDLDAQDSLLALSGSQLRYRTERKMYMAQIAAVDSTANAFCENEKAMVMKRHNAKLSAAANSGLGALAVNQPTLIFLIVAFGLALLAHNKEVVCGYIVPPEENKKEDERDEDDGRDESETQKKAENDKQNGTATNHFFKDEKDDMLISLLRDGKSMSHTQLARQTGIPRGSLTYRISKLKAEGIL